ncbi:replication initiation protein [Cytobacillus pseudoceanisediminis]|uniref:replication initiation protein n=1 Tax=Cytobacillus pseudoceanisediminis TaxID=3051614 RepID=UPI003659366D
MNLITNADIYEIDSKDWITKANTIIESQYKLTLQEQRILLITASKVQPSDEDFKPYKFRVSDLVEKVGVGNQSSMYTYIKNIVKGLQSKTVEFKKDNRTFVANWLVTSIYEDNEGTVIIKFNPDLKEFFLQLKDRFTTYQLENVIRLSSVYSIRIYELLKQYEFIKKRTISIDELREKLGIEKNKYKQYGHFKDRVINVAMNELSEKTDISFTIEEKKKGRKVVGITFHIKGKKDGGVIITQSQDGNREHLESRLRNLGVKSNLYNYLFEKFSVEQIERNIVYAEGKIGQVKSLGGFTYKAIVSDYAQTDTVNEQESLDSDLVLQNKVLNHLIEYWKKDRSPKQKWFVNDMSIEELNRSFDTSEHSAEELFELVKQPIYEMFNLSS